MHDIRGNQWRTGLGTAGLLGAALAGLGCDETSLSRPGEETERERGVAYLMINVEGQGAVLSADAQIDCGDECHGTYVSGDVVPLVTLPEPGWHFQRFDGDLECASGRVPVDFERRCVAVFERDDDRLPSLELVIYGAGTVTLPDIARRPGCDDHCIYSFQSGTELRLEPIAARGSKLSRLAGHIDCEDGHVRLDGHRRCIAVFAEDPAQLAEISLDVAGPGRLDLAAATPASRSQLPEFAPCDGPCLRRVPLGVEQTLVADAHPPARFSHFEGDPDCHDGVITPRPGLHCRAVFSEGRHRIAVRVLAGRARLEVWNRGARSLLDCNIDYRDGSYGCYFDLPQHSTVTIEPRPFDRRAFYSGDCTGPVVVLDRPKSCEIQLDLPRLAGCKGPDQDADPPRVPLAITAAVPSCERVELSWAIQSSPTVSPDPCDVERFELRRDGYVLAPRIGGTSYSDASRFARSSTHRYSVTPIDAAGNYGTPSTIDVFVPACRPERIRVLALLAQRADGPASGPPRGEMVARLEGETGSAVAVWRALTGRPLEIETFARSWGVLPHGWARYCTSPRVACDADRMVEDYLRVHGDRVPEGPFDQVLLFVPGMDDAFVPFDVRHRGESLAGLAFGADASVSTPARLARAVGQAFGAAVASRLACPPGATLPDPSAPKSSCAPLIGDDPIDLMGRGRDSLSAHNLERLGALDDADRYVVPGEATVRLRPVEERLRGGRQLVVPLDDSGPESVHYSVDLQRAPEFTEASWDARRSGVTVRLVPMPGHRRREPGTLLPPGWQPRPFSSFWDPTTGVAIDVTEISETEATVRVRRGVFLPGAR